MEEKKLEWQNGRSQNIVPSKRMKNKGKRAGRSSNVEKHDEKRTSNKRFKFRWSAGMLTPTSARASWSYPQHKTYDIAIPAPGYDISQEPGIKETYLDGGAFDLSESPNHSRTAYRPALYQKARSSYWKCKCPYPGHSSQIASFLPVDLELRHRLLGDTPYWLDFDVVLHRIYLAKI